MNDVSEQDLELLEEYLDEALAPEEVERLHARLREDSELTIVLEGLRAERQVRTAVWTSLEPTETQARQFANRVASAARRQAKWSSVARYSRFAGAAAACILVGFFSGWIGHNRGNVALPGGAFEGTVNDVSAELPSDRVTVSKPVPVPASPGVQISEIAVPDASGHPTQMLVVRQVSPGAEAIGLQQGDLFLAVDGQPVRDVETLAKVLGRNPGTHVLQIIRHHHVLELTGRVQP